MNRTNVWRVILATALLAITGYCVFGFLATLEPGIRNVAIWRAGYAIVGIGTFVFAVRLAWLASSLLRSK